MPDHGNPGTRDGAYALGFVDAALELDRTRAAFFDETNRRSNRFFVADLIRTKRHVGDDVRARRTAGNGLRMMHDLIDRYRRRFVVAQYHVSDAIADQNDVDARVFDELTERSVVSGRDRENGLAFAAFDSAGGEPANRRVFLRLVRAGLMGSAVGFWAIHGTHNLRLGPGGYPERSIRKR